MYIHF